MFKEKLKSTIKKSIKYGSHGDVQYTRVPNLLHHMGLKITKQYTTATFFTSIVRIRRLFTSNAKFIVYQICVIIDLELKWFYTEEYLI